MPRDTKIALLMSWHRRLGLALAVIILILATTGMLINHTSDLKLSSIQLNNKMLLKWYGLAQHQESLTGYQVSKDKWLAVSGNGLLFLNQTAVADCPPPLLGALAYDGLFLALCKDQLLLITEQGLIAETLGTTMGLPTSASRLGTAEGKLAVETNTEPVLFDLNNLTTSPIDSQPINWANLAKPPELMLKTMHEDEPSISLETVLLDIHSGRIFGRFGVIFMDIAAIILLILAFSGLWAWLRHNKLQKQS